MANKLKPIQASKFKTTVKRIPSGVFSFDVLTGGGIPVGKVTIFEGNKSSGKTTHSLRIIGNYLAEFENKKVLYVDFENSFDAEWTSRFVEDSDMDRILLIEPLYAEEGIDAIVDILNNDKDVGMLFVDSLANMIPIADAEKSAYEDTVGAQAKVINKMFRKILPIMSSMRREDRELTVLLINQQRVKIGATAFTSGTTKPGGVYQDFIASLDIKFSYIGNVESKSVTIKTKHQFKVEKSKIARAVPYRKGEFSIVLVEHNGLSVGQSDDYTTVINSAKRCGVLERDGNKWKFGENVFKTLAEVEDAVRNDEAFYITLYEKTRDSLIDNLLVGDDDAD